MLLAQAIVALGLVALSTIGLQGGLVTLGVLALIVAFASSTQDIVVDAWRIEAAGNGDELGLLSAAYQLGYRGALLVTDALILISASRFGWPLSYTAMAVLMAIGLCASFMAVEPTRAGTVSDSKHSSHRCGVLGGLWTPLSARSPSSFVSTAGSHF
jgi:PAT family beta-lactamase induction signal transducer AmpG